MSILKLKLFQNILTEKSSIQIFDSLLAFSQNRTYEFFSFKFKIFLRHSEFKISNFSQIIRLGILNKVFGSTNVASQKWRKINVIKKWIREDQKQYKAFLQKL